uniref:Uncharacterized protein n=1 Tax=Parastrongyloides trichosuri TaxID=131310 RepID=A0A0N4Z0P8_PARTI
MNMTESQNITSTPITTPTQGHWPETPYLVAGGLLLAALVVTLIFCVYKLCKPEPTDMEDKASFRSKQQKDLRNGKPKKKHLYDPKDHMNTKDRANEKKWQSALVKNSSNVLPRIGDKNKQNNVKTLKEQKQLNPVFLNNNLGEQSIKNSLSIKECPKPKNKDSEIKRKYPKEYIGITTSPKSESSFIEKPKKKYSLMEENNTIRHHSTREQKNKFVKKKFDDCCPNHSKKKTITFATFGQPNNWTTINEEKTISNFSFQISSVNSN